jgi:phosphatidylglycerophosphatase C
MNKLIVFDFDKTLTYKDSLRGFYYFAAKKNLGYPFRLFRYYFLVVKRKLNLISLIDLNYYAIKLFLADYNENDLDALGKDYIKRIIFNQIYYKDYKELSQNEENQVIVTSASFEIYLKHIGFRHLLATELEFENSKPVGIKFLNHNINKVKKLNENGITSIDVLYTDSISDLPLARIAKQTILVRKDEKIVCNSVEEFLKAV